MSEELLQRQQNIDWLRKKQFDEVSQQFRTTWDMYLKFYTVFLTFNISALGLTIQYMAGADRLPIVVAFLLQNINSLVTAVRIGHFSRHMAARLNCICSDFLRLEGSGNDSRDLRFLTDSAIPGELGYWGGIANAMGHGLLIACWVSVLFLPKFAK